MKSELWKRRDVEVICWNSLGKAWLIFVRWWNKTILMGMGYTCVQVCPFGSYECPLWILYKNNKNTNIIQNRTTWTWVHEMWIPNFYWYCLAIHFNPLLKHQSTITWSFLALYTTNTWVIFHAFLLFTWLWWYLIYVLQLIFLSLRYFTAYLTPLSGIDS